VADDVLSTHRYEVEVGRKRLGRGVGAAHGFNKKLNAGAGGQVFIM
jgi:hypothetical protein